MRIAILTTQCPFVLGGAELHARNLERALRAEGHEAEIVTMPFKWYPSKVILDHMLAARCLDVSEFNGVKIDLAIGLKFPAYLMQHPNKAFWILHQHRQAYDLWDNGLTDLFDDENGQIAREAIRAADNAELGGALRIFANSANVAGRLLKHNNIVAAPLYHPPPLADRLVRGEFGAYFYYPSRISSAKRQEFVLRSLVKADRSARVVFSGAPDNPEYGIQLRRLAHDLGVEDRVEWKGFVSEDEMIALYAGARGVIFTPVDEDLGYIALEAMLAGKPLLTLTDAGEPATLIQHEAEGLIVDPDPSQLGQAMNRLMDDPTLARALGEAAFERYRALDISWSRAVEVLTTTNTSVRRAASAGMAPLAIDSLPTPSRETAAADVKGSPDAPQDHASNGKTVTSPRESTSGAAVMALEPRLEAPRVAQPLPQKTGIGASKREREPTLDTLAALYGFDAHLAQHRSYYETHWTRYQETLDVLRRHAVKPRRILELGTSEPYVFTAILKQAFPEAEFTLVQRSPAGVNWRRQFAGGPDGGGSFEVSVFGLNVETTTLPFAEGEFDLVLAMEILEHFVIDPSFVFREAQRVLRKGGVFLVTTPNLISLPGVQRALNGTSPYSFGVFVPWHGVYGRHNREYTPREVESLGRYASFATALLETTDVYAQEEVSEPLSSFMKTQGHPLDLRGQNIFYLGRKEASSKPAPLPADLFVFDPAVFSGEIALRRTQESAETFLVTITNTSPLPWPATGPNRIRLSVDEIGQDGLIAQDACAFELPFDLAPGASVEIPIRAEKREGIRGRWHEIGLYVEGAGPFKSVGRTRTVSLFAENLALAGDPRWN